MKVEKGDKARFVYPENKDIKPGKIWTIDKVDSHGNIHARGNGPHWFYAWEEYYLKYTAILKKGKWVLWKDLLDGEIHRPCMKKHVTGGIMSKKQRVGKLKVIGIAGINGDGGSAGAGKDSFTDYLVLNNPDLFTRYSFAEPIKKIATDIFGFTHDDVYDPVLKEKYNDFWETSPRKFLQLVGTELFRNRFRMDVWLKLAELKIRQDREHVFIIPDMRFENEARFVHDMGGKIILVRTDRKAGTKESHHPSEDPLDIKYVDYMINNNGTLADLREEADRLYNKLFKRS